MTTYHKILLGLVAAAYLISPIDIIPDFFIPYFGLFDDAAVVGAIIYYIKHGRLPEAFYKKSRGKGFWSKAKASKEKAKSYQFTQKKSDAENSTQQNQAEDNRYKKEPPKEEIKRKDGKAEQNQGQNSEPLQSAYQILGVEPNATKEDIHAAYRAAVKQYHPDKVAHLGKELQELANRKFIEIQGAYNKLMKMG
ncbi:MAG: DnaJ domain-containing protein [Desulfamplus sp.]|nr:DnaJ domain-containing protein [Desulfamplus sp.]